MSKHFVEYINIKGFKCFKDFSVEGFKRVNLISGKNNVGKTALMEAIYVNVISNNTSNMLNILAIVDFIRNQIDNKPGNVKNLTDLVSLKSNVHSIQCAVDETDIGRNYKIKIDDHLANIPESSIETILKSGLDGTKIACFISGARDSQEDIIRSFTAIQKKDRESDVYNLIHAFDDTIENVKVIGGNSIQCKVVEVDGSFSYRSISEFGDGLRHYISVIADLFSSENSFLCIDEVDNGIHYSCLDQLWEIILSLSKELNVQVFATTHSKECIESYCRVAEKLNDKDITLTTLVKNKEKAVKAIVRDYEVFTDSIHDEREVRGW